MDKVVELAAAAGYRPDHVVASDEVPRGRPGPAPALANVVALGIEHVGACVKVDDTAPGILEGRPRWHVDRGAALLPATSPGLTWDEYRAL